jgi:ADP-ribose pyrophosphatase YjhB (NUDIX family)
MHRIQQHIFGILITQPSARFSDLKPKEVESNLFMYHLKQLIDQGYVAKVKDGSYSLTAPGMVYADRLSLKTFQPRLQPRIVTLLMIRNQHGEYLMYRRKRQPLINMVGFPYGKIHTGETIKEAAGRELLEKTGYQAVLNHIGDGYITMSRDGEAVSQILFHLFAGREPQGDIKKTTAIGEAFWADPTQIPGWELMPSVIDLLEASRSGQRFFLEKAYSLESAA